MVTDKKFTKGEWIIKASICFESEIRTEDGVRIAETKSYGEGFNDATEEEQKANAKLIAAAPEMYSALESSLQMLEQTLKYRNANGIRMGNVFLEATISQVKEAIKKATE